MHRSEVLLSHSASPRNTERNERTLCIGDAPVNQSAELVRLSYWEQRLRETLLCAAEAPRRTGENPFLRHPSATLSDACRQRGGNVHVYVHGVRAVDRDMHAFVEAALPGCQLIHGEVEGDERRMHPALWIVVTPDAQRRADERGAMWRAAKRAWHTPGTILLVFAICILLTASLALAYHWRGYRQPLRDLLDHIGLHEWTARGDARATSYATASPSTD